jgi:hypothetical protein
MFLLVHWKKVAEALFSDSNLVAAGKRLLLRILRSQHSHIRVQQRGFCRLPRGGISCVRLNWFFYTVAKR